MKRGPPSVPRQPSDLGRIEAFELVKGNYRAIAGVGRSPLRGRQLYRPADAPIVKGEPYVDGNGSVPRARLPGRLCRPSPGAIQSPYIHRANGLLQIAVSTLLLRSNGDR